MANCRYNFLPHISFPSPNCKLGAGFISITIDHRHRIGIITEVPLLSEPLMSMEQCNGAAHVASRILAAILLASKNGGFDRVLLGSSLQKLDYQ